MFAFASTVLVLSLFNVHARHVTVPNVVVGMAIFYGGLAQFMAGMWSFAVGNTFCATGEFQPFRGLPIIQAPWNARCVSKRTPSLITFLVFYDQHLYLWKSANNRFCATV